MVKTERLSLKVLEEQKHALRRMAEADGEPVSVVVRRMINAEAKRRRLILLEAERRGLLAEEQEAKDDHCQTTLG